MEIAIKVPASFGSNWQIFRSTGILIHVSLIL